MSNKSSDSAIALGLLTAVFLWGANNTAIRYLMRFWPPLATGSIRFLIAGGLVVALLRWTNWLGARNPVPPELNRRLWWKVGLTFALYIAAFNWAVKLTAVSHIVLYLAAAPVWALLWEGRPRRDWKSAQRYGAAALAFAGTVTLFWPSQRGGGRSTVLVGEILGLACSFLWTIYGLQCREFRDELTGAEIAGHTFWRAGALMAPAAAWELWTKPMAWRADLVAAQVFCIVGGGVVAFALWNHALGHWPISKVYLFSNLVPVCTMAWAHFCLDEPVTSTFWLAMGLIGAGVFLGQTDWQKVFGARWSPE